MQSAMLHSQEYLQKEISLERMIGPIPQGAAISSLMHINRFGVIPKSHNTGKWRLITDLSHPAGKSVNDGIDPEFCSLSYISVDHAARVISRLGRGSLLAKIDIEAAYRLVPVHPCDRVLQAVKWEGKLYVDPICCLSAFAQHPRSSMPLRTRFNGTYSNKESNTSFTTWMIIS